MNRPKLHIRPGAIPNDAWTPRPSDICCICGGSTSIDDHRDLTPLHDPSCSRCPLCEVPVRLFQPLFSGRVLTVVLHPRCYASILEAR